MSWVVITDPPVGARPLDGRVWCVGRLTVHTAAAPGDGVVLRASGELDADVAHALVDTVRAAAGRDRGRVRLDLSSIGFIDSSGLHALVQLRDELGTRFEVAPAGRATARLFAITGTAALFE